MNRIVVLVLLFTLGCSSGIMAQFNLRKALSAGLKALQAITLSDARVEQYVGEYIRQSDSVNTLCGPDDPYTLRLERITKSFNNKDGINIKVYRTEDVNAFACADGSVRVYSGLMDIMSDEEILGVIGHEIGHVRNKDTKDAFRNALLTSALRDGVSSAGGTAARLSDSQLGSLGEALMSARYSQRQEYDADRYGYEFLKSHGVNPWAMALSFEKLKKMEEEMGGNKSSKVQQLFSTHPDIEARTRVMAELAASEGFVRPDGK